MWFCGWSEQDFHTLSRIYLERQQGNSMDVYEDFFRACSELLRSNGLLVVHVGRTRSMDMGDELAKRSGKAFVLVDSVVEDVANIENHGVTDKGSTKSHEFQFFVKNKECEE